MTTDQKQAGHGNGTAAGTFERDTRYIPTRITADGRDGYPVEPGRYRLVVARACPWANRAIIVRRLLGLEDVLSMGICGPTHDERSWTFDLDPGGVDPVLGIERLQDAYFARDPRTTTGHHRAGDRRRPDRRGGHQRLRADHPRPVDGVDGLPPAGAPGPLPGAAARRDRRGQPSRSSRDVNNGVYRCGFAGSQEAYEKAYDRLFDRLDWLSERLAGQRYLVGDTITEADVRLFTTLARFDAVYHGHFKCNRHKLTEMPVLWAYARDLFQTPGFGDTIDFVHIKQHYYVVHRDINPTGSCRPGPTCRGWLDAARPRGARRPPVRRRHPARPDRLPGDGSTPRHSAPLAGADLSLAHALSRSELREPPSDSAETRPVGPACRTMSRP